MRKLLTLFTLALIAMTASADVTYTNGFGDDDSYEPATLVDGYYEIDNGGKLFWFAQQVNAGTGANYKAKLTADIDLGGNNHTWTAIGTSSSKPFAGEFDGQGHSISNLYVNTDINYAGFIGYHTGNYDIKNFSISGSVTTTGTTSAKYATGVIAYSIGNHRIEDIHCSVNIDLPNSGSAISTRSAGIVVGAASCTINRCVYDGTINGNTTNLQVGGIVGWADGDNVTITNCLFSGTLNSSGTGTNSAYLGGIMGYSGNNRSGLKCSNNLSIGTINSQDGATRSGALVGVNKYTPGSIYINNFILTGLPITGSETGTSKTPTVTKVTTAQLTNGTLPALLNSHDWTQGTSNPIPSLNHVYGTNGFCTYGDDGYQPANLVNGYYEIDNGGKLFWLAEQVNGGTGTAYNAKLTADIDLDGDNHTWTPMGNETFKYTGEFDGQGYSISNLYINTNATHTAFIGYHNGSKYVKNFAISGDVTHTGNVEGNCVSGVVAFANGAHVQDVISSVNLNGTSSITKGVKFAGIVTNSGASGVTVDRCLYSGTINGYGTPHQVTGIMACTAGGISPVSITNSVFCGKLISTNASAYVGGLVGYLNSSKFTLSNNLCIGQFEIASTSGTYSGLLVSRTNSTPTSSNNHYLRTEGAPTNIRANGSHVVNATEITTSSDLTDGTTLTALGTANWAQDTNNPVPKAFTCTESNGGAVAAVTGTVCAYNFNVFKNAVKDYATVDMSGANMTNNIEGTDMESMLTNNSLVYVPSTTAYCGKNIVNDGICDDFELTEGKPFVPTTGFETSAATYTRTVSNAWGTICLPYEVESDANVTYYTAGTINGDVLTLTSAETVPAGTPAICKFAATGANTIESYVVNVCTDVAADPVNDDITLIGSFTKQTIYANDVPNAYYISGGQFWHATGTLNVNPFRAYFTTSSSTPSNKFDIAVDDDDVTAIAALAGEGDVTVTAIYGADGKQQADLQYGLNIVKLSNGKTKKIMLK